MKRCVTQFYGKRFCPYVVVTQSFPFYSFQLCPTFFPRIFKYFNFWRIFQPPRPQPLHVRLRPRLAGGVDGREPSGDLGGQVRGAEEAPQEKDGHAQAGAAQV